MRKTIDLNGKWKLYIAPNKEVVKEARTPTTDAALKSRGYLCIDATVPGNFELDMTAAGILPDLFFGTNPLLCQREENKHLWYTRTFIFDGSPEMDHFLRFEGLDTFCEIYLNGTLIGSSENMLVEHEFAAVGLVDGENELTVHILPTAIKAREFETNILNRALKYNTDSIYVRKAPYMFGWDIMPRTVSGGIWRGVSLVSKPKTVIEECYLATGYLSENHERALLSGYLRINTDEDLLSDIYAVVRGRCGDSVFENKLNFFGVNAQFSASVSNPKLWWPVRAGDQNLYEVQVDLYLRGELCDSYKFRLGIRTVRLERTSVIDADGKGKFEFLINGKKIFIMGTNWVPLDAFPSQNVKRLHRALSLVEDIGCNMIRLWGGNVYEDEAFYDWCDEHGILLWQDFAMGCVTFYPQDEKFASALRNEAVSVVKRLRSHPSLALWAGDNECDAFAYGRVKNGEREDPNKNVLTRKVLPEVIHTYDGFRPYLPSSPYIDDIAYKTGLSAPEDHIWGPRNYFKSSYYTESTALFASETGFHGCPSPDSLRKYISKEHLWPPMLDNGRPDEEWLAHAASMEIENVGPYEYRIALMLRQVSELFSKPDGTCEERLASPYGDNVSSLFDAFVERFGNTTDSLCKLAMASQIFQAEAFKFIIERFRIRKETHGGLIWWNILDGWPQISDAVVDYYFVKKLAYEYIKRSQAPVCLMFDEPKDGGITLCGANELPSPATIEYSVCRASEGAAVCTGMITLDAHGSAKLYTVPLTEGEREAFIIRWRSDDGTEGFNHYISNIKGISFDKYMEILNDFKLGRFEGFGEE